MRDACAYLVWSYWATFHACSNKTDLGKRKQGLLPPSKKEEKNKGTPARSVVVMNARRGPPLVSGHDVSAAVTTRKMGILSPREQQKGQRNPALPRFVPVHKRKIIRLWQGCLQDNPVIERGWRRQSCRGSPSADPKGELRAVSHNRSAVQLSLARGTSRSSWSWGTP